MKKRLVFLLLFCCLILLLTACKNNSNNTEEHVHSWNDGMTIEPTCTEPGVKVYTCTECNAFRKEDIPALGHDEQAVVTAPTCTEDGYTTYICSRCEMVLNIGDHTFATGHIWDAGVVTKEPTDTEPGEKTFTCTVCELTETEGLPSPGHDYVPTVTPPTCDAGGYTTYICSHDGCGNSYIADRVAPLGHDYVESIVSPTCTEQGYTEHTCSRCSASYQDTYTAQLGHDWGDDVEWQDTETGSWYRTHECSRCGEKEDVQIVKEHGQDESGSGTVIDFGELPFEDNP